MSNTSTNFQIDFFEVISPSQNLPDSHKIILTKQIWANKFLKSSYFNCFKTGPIND